MSRRLTLLVLLLAASTAAAAVPPASAHYRRAITAQAHAQFGPGAPVATLAAQLHQESAWNPAARSSVGAQGLAQFMPATAADMARRHPAACAPANPLSARWAIRCAARYDADLHRAITAATPCDRWAMTLSAYNGGLGWVYRDQRAAARAGLDRRRWWNNTALVNAGRSAASWRENRGYPRRILRVLAPRYVAAGWGASACPGGSHAPVR